jgi:hypothetical protein
VRSIVPAARLPPLRPRERLRAARHLRPSPACPLLGAVRRTLSGLDATERRARDVDVLHPHLGAQPLLAELELATADLNASPDCAAGWPTTSAPCARGVGGCGGGSDRRGHPPTSGAGRRAGRLPGRRPIAARGVVRLVRARMARQVLGRGRHGPDLPVARAPGRLQSTLVLAPEMPRRFSHGVRHRFRATCDRPARARRDDRTGRGAGSTIRTDRRGSPTMWAATASLESAFCYTDDTMRRFGRLNEVNIELDIPYIGNWPASGSPMS